MTDKQTIAVYDSQIDAYVEMIKQHSHDPLLHAFLKLVPAGGHVLDLGCGPGDASAAMIEQGLSVDPIDGSEQMVKLANEVYKVGARQAYFEQIDGVEIYHAVWANFSLLHASQDEFPIVLKNLRRAIKSGGYLHIAMKLGSNTNRDSLGRFYSYYTEQELVDHLSDSGFKVENTQSGELMGLAGYEEPWIALLARAV